MNANRLAWLDLFRGIAACVVVGVHFHGQLHLPEIRFGGLAVDLFFVLSGIVLGQKYELAVREGLTFGEFAWQRMRRLYPMILIVSALVMLMSAVGLPEVPWALATMGSVLALLFVFPYSPTFGTGALFPADLPVWSLFAELLANVVWFVALRWGKSATTALFLLAMLAFLALKFQLGGLVIRADESGGANILAGQARALAWFGVGYAISLRRPRPPVPVSMILAAFACCCMAVQWAWMPLPLAEVVLIAVGALLLASLMHVSPTSPAMVRLCSWLGMFSYPIYIVHIPASRIGVWLTAHGVRTTIAYGGGLLAVGIVATLLNEWVLRRLPRVWPLRRAAAPSVAADTTTRVG